MLCVYTIPTHPQEVVHKCYENSYGGLLDVKPLQLLFLSFRRMSSSAPLL